jgi:uncharacterized membrane protein
MTVMRPGAAKASSANRQTSKNIESILKLEKDDEQKLSRLHRFSHMVGAFVGTIHFVAVQCIAVCLWIFINSHFSNWLPFDPFPFSLLSTVLALEAVLLTSFVLIRQNTMDLRSERRNHLDLQINLLAEKEATSILTLLREIADHLHVEVSTDLDREELAKKTPVESIARDLRSKEAKS